MYKIELILSTEHSRKCRYMYTRADSPSDGRLQANCATRDLPSKQHLRSARASVHCSPRAFRRDPGRRFFRPRNPAAGVPHSAARRKAVQGRPVRENRCAPRGSRAARAIYQPPLAAGPASGPGRAGGSLPPEECGFVAARTAASAHCPPRATERELRRRAARACSRRRTRRHAVGQSCLVLARVLRDFGGRRVIFFL